MPKYSKFSSKSGFLNVKWEQTLILLPTVYTLDWVKVKDWLHRDVKSDQNNPLFFDFLHARALFFFGNTGFWSSLQLLKYREKQRMIRIRI